MDGTFHRRNLPLPAVSFGSTDGKELFRNSLENGFLEGYFILAEHFVTQGHPAFCGVGSLTMALNALLMDPNRVWQGVWRWFDESMLDCCEPLDVIKLKGIVLPKLACLARCNGAQTTVKYGSATSLEEFRNDVKLISKQSCERSVVMIASYHRGTLKQSGSGHFSPIGAYNEAKDMVLIMDVARFKYPPHWIPLPLLHQSMQVIDPETGKSRGYMLLNATTKLYEKCHCTHTCSDDKTTTTESDNGNSGKECGSPTDPAPKDVLNSILNHVCPSCNGTDSGAEQVASCCSEAEKV